MTYWDDGFRPHRFPSFEYGEDTECLAWKCQACGKWVNDAGDDSECPIDWRAAQ